MPASPSIRPSWPPPNTVSCVTARTLCAGAQLRQRERGHLGVEQAALLVPQVLDLVEWTLQGAVPRAHERGVLLRDRLEARLHLLELRRVLLPLAGELGEQR